MQETILYDEKLAAELADTLKSSKNITALTTLESKQTLSSEIIIRVLRACVPTNCFIVDPLFVNPAFQSRSSASRIRNEKLQDVSTVIISSPQTPTYSTSTSNSHSGSTTTSKTLQLGLGEFPWLHHRLRYTL